MKKNKLIALLLAFSLTVGFVSSSTTAYAAEINKNNTVTINQVQSKNPTILTPKINIYQGLKKTAVVYALKYGGSLLGKIVGSIGDKKVAAMLVDNSYVIGSFLEGISTCIEANLIDFMIFELGFPQSAARIIAWTICTLFL